MPMNPNTAIDLFAGAGGLSVGLTEAGFSVKAAVEIDAMAAKTYALNHPTTVVLTQDIKKLSGPQLMKHAGLKVGELGLLTGCPPCQGFSTLRTRKRKSTAPDPRNELLFDILRLVWSIRPAALVMENVPGLKDDERFRRFTDGLRSAGYAPDYRVVNAQDFGVPQRRKRLVLIALRKRKVPERCWTFSGVSTSVRDAISYLPKAGASGDELHDLPETRSASVMARIRATPKNGGSQRDLPDHLRLACHRRSNGYSDVYGRMAWDDVAPTITSGCNNPSRGRFLHPTANRAITLREAALLQTFPDSYRFDLTRGKEHVARQIGNAFPPQLIRPIASALLAELRQ